MVNCIIHPIPLAEMIADRSALTYRRNFGQPYTQISYIWYIEGPQENIIVDAGVDSEYLSKERGIPSRDIESLDSAMMKIGLAPSDIDLVIITHLHSDHVARGHDFPNARFIVQKKELDFAKNPHPTVAPQYPKKFFEGLKFELVEGDTEVCSGISIISTPGHTTGGQSVSVQTDRGIAVISGLCTIRENFEPPEPIGKTMPVLPCGVLVNLFDAYDSLLKIKEMADIVISLHDHEYGQINHIP